MRDPLVAKWPRGVLSPRNIVTQIDRPQYSGPPPLVGRPQVAVSPAAGWRIVYEGVPFNASNRSAFFSLLDRIGAFAEPIYVGPYDFANGPVARAGAVSPIFYTFSGGYIFSTGYRFASSIQDCVLPNGAAAGAIEIEVTNSIFAPLSVGDYFEIDGRLHRIVNIRNTIWTIWPPTRSAYANETALEIADPRMKSYLAPESQALASRLIMGIYGDATLEFVEAGW